MITTEDIIEFCELSPEEVEAIAECTAEPWVLCIAHAECLMSDKNGLEAISKYFDEDIQQAMLKGNLEHAHALKKTYRAFKRAHV